MFDDLAAYFYENVVQSFDEYRDAKASGVAGRSNDIRKALIAASALFHLREHLPSGCKMSRFKAERRCPEYGLLADIANASKHRKLTADTPHGRALVRSAADLTEEIVVTQYSDEEGEYRHVEKRVIAKLIDGTTQDVLDTLTEVMNFWQTYLHEKGIIAKRKIYVSDSSRQPKSRAEANNGNLGLIITAGLRFAESVRLQRYNYATSGVEPVDLTGSEMTLTIQRPPQYKLDLAVTHEQSGTTLTRTVELTVEESETFASLQTDGERSSYANGLPSIKAAQKELLTEAQSLQAKQNV
ncbi:hypothetical protein [Paraburkholderia lacunae]|nr:hypothetical protein [Paraburkholderia lacunae]